MTTDPVTYAVHNGIAHLELNRPQASNAVDMSMALALDAAVTWAASDAGVRSVWVTGAGKRFCAGGDVRSFAAFDNARSDIEELAATLDIALQKLAELAKPVVACVHGAVAGAGLSLMLSCDLIVSCASTKFATAYAGIGLTPDCGLSYLLPRVVGQQRALELLTTNRVLTAQESLDWGLITEVRDDADARGRAEELAEVLAAGPAFALGQAKRLVRTSWETTRAAVGRDEAQTIGRAFEHPHAQHRIREFLLR